MRRFFEEMGARSLGAVLGIYVLISFVILRLIVTLENTLALPPWVPIVALVLLSIGLPIILSTAFVQQVSATTGTEEDPQRRRAALKAAAIQRVFTWRNALVGGVGGFAALAIGTGAWILAGSASGISSLDPPRDARASASPALATSPEAQAERAFRALADAIRSMDVEATLAAYDDSPDFRYTFGEELVEDRASFDAQVRESFASLEAIEVWEVGEIEATRIDEDHVLIVADYREVAVDRAGNRTSYTGQHTNVFVRIGDAWRIAYGRAVAEPVDDGGT